VVSAVRPLIQATLALKARHSALDLHVSAAKSIELIERVQAGELDAAIAVREPGARPELVWTALYTEPMVLLAPRRLERPTCASAAARQPFIRFDPSQHTGRLVERTLKRLRVKPQEFLELNALESIVDLVRSGMGRVGRAAAAGGALGGGREAAGAGNSAGGGAKGGAGAAARFGDGRRSWLRWSGSSDAAAPRPVGFGCALTPPTSRIRRFSCPPMARRSRRVG
jgi:hypothetical protein